MKEEMETCVACGQDIDHSLPNLINGLCHSCSNNEKIKKIISERDKPTLLDRFLGIFFLVFGIAPLGIAIYVGYMTMTSEKNFQLDFRYWATFIYSIVSAALTIPYSIFLLTQKGDK